MKRAGLLLVALALPGCKGFLQANDPVVQSVACTITAAVLAPLEALAVSLGFPLALIEQLYGDACNLAAVQGMSQHDAEQFALRQVTERARAMKAMGVRFEEPADGGGK